MDARRAAAAEAPALMPAPAALEMLLSELFGDDDGWSGYNEMTPRLSACLASLPKPGDGSADEGPTKDADARLAKRISTMALVQRAIVGMSAAATTRIQAAARRRRSINLKKKKSKEEAAAGGGGGRWTTTSTRR